MITEIQAERIGELLFSYVLAIHKEEIIANIADQYDDLQSEELDDEASSQAFDLATQELHARLADLQDRKDKLDEVIGIFITWTLHRGNRYSTPDRLVFNLKLADKRFAFGRRVAFTEAVFNYLWTEGFGIWPGLEYEWEDVERVLGPAAIRKFRGEQTTPSQNAKQAVDWFLERRLIGHPNNIKQFELLQRYYIERKLAYINWFETMKEMFVEAWNAIGDETEDELETLPRTLTIDTFDEWWDDQDGDVVNFYQVLELTPSLAW